MSIKKVWPFTNRLKVTVTIKTNAIEPKRLLKLNVKNSDCFSSEPLFSFDRMLKGHNQCIATYFTVSDALLFKVGVPLLLILSSTMKDRTFFPLFNRIALAPCRKHFVHFFFDDLKWLLVNRHKRNCEKSRMKQTNEFKVNKVGKKMPKNVLYSCEKGAFYVFHAFSCPSHELCHYERLYRYLYIATLMYVRYTSEACNATVQSLFIW